MKRLLAFLLLALPALAQSFCRLPSPMPNAKICVCPVPTGGNPCPAPASIYQDPGFTIPTTQPVTVGPDGNFGFWAPCAHYVVQIHAPYNLEFLISLGGAVLAHSLESSMLVHCQILPLPARAHWQPLSLHFPQQATRLAGSSVPPLDS
jgi:hypothetical protein